MRPLCRKRVEMSILRRSPPQPPLLWRRGLGVVETSAKAAPCSLSSSATASAPTLMRRPTAQMPMRWRRWPPSSRAILVQELRRRGRRSDRLSEWESEEAALGWRRVAEHAEMQRRGREAYYQNYTLFAGTPNRVHRFERAWIMTDALKRAAVTLRIIGDDLNPQEISNFLGSEPRRGVCKGEAFLGHNGQERAARTGLCHFGGDYWEDAPDIGCQITTLLSRLTQDLEICRSVHKPLSLLRQRRWLLPLIGLAASP